MQIAEGLSPSAMEFIVKKGRDKMKRIFCIFMAIALICTCMAEMAFAAETDNPTPTVVYSTTAEERDRIFEAEMERIMSELNENNVSRGPKYHYGSENLPYQYKTLGGYAGNQVERGYRFPTGGGFYYSDSGGPTVNGSVSITIPTTLNNVSISFGINLGQRSESSGFFVSVPNKTDYFKLYIEKELEVRPYVVYRKRSGTEGTWEVDHWGSVEVVVSVTSYAKKV